MGDDQGGPAREGGGQGLLHQRLVLRVEVAGGLVEHDDRRVLHQHPGDGETLALAAGQAVPPLPHDRVVAVGETHDHVVDLGGAAGVDELPVGGVGPGVPEVLGHAVVEEVRVLRHDSDRPPERVEGEVADVVAVDADRSLADVVEPRDERAERRLAGTRRTDERHELARARCGR